MSAAIGLENMAPPGFGDLPPEVGASQTHCGNHPMVSNRNVTNHTG
jgi:hypothetical protein